ncbi:unnamed protein product, partial [marine sediment metagenome]
VCQISRKVLSDLAGEKLAGDLHFPIPFLVLIYVARQGEWGNILILLAGFIVSRIFLSRMIGKRKKD